MCKRYILITVVILGIFSAANSKCGEKGVPTHSLHGRITDWLTDHGIMAVTIVAIDSHKKEYRTLTKEDGSYKLENLPTEPKLTVRYSQGGYTPNPLEVQITFKQEVAEWNGRLFRLNAPKDYWRSALDKLTTMTGTEQIEEANFVADNAGTAGREAIAEELRRRISSGNTDSQLTQIATVFGIEQLPPQMQSPNDGAPKSEANVNPQTSPSQPEPGNPSKTEPENTSTSEAQNKVEGIIEGRNGPDIILKTSQNPNMVVMLTDSTDVGQVQGVFKARSKQMSMAALIPGLAVSVEGDYNSQNVLVARKVRFKGNDLKQAYAIQAGMHDTKEQAAKNQHELEQQNAELQAQNEALQKHQAEIQANQEKIGANKAAVDAAIARFGQLDDYYIMDEVTVLFGNGKTSVAPQYVPQLTALAQKAATVEGYMIEVKGYASATGAAALNQQLSQQRAENVTNVLLQQGMVPLTRMLAPGAMGESEQVATDKTAEGQAENRRVVVRVLQNKALAGVAAN